MARACSSCSAVSTESNSPSTGKVPMPMPASIRRSCSSFSVCSRGEWGRAFQPLEHVSAVAVEAHVASVGCVLRPVDGIDIAHVGHGHRLQAGF